LAEPREGGPRLPAPLTITCTALDSGPNTSLTDLIEFILLHLYMYVIINKACSGKIQ
jgi:hypothetical protein